MEFVNEQPPEHGKGNIVLLTLTEVSQSQRIFCFYTTALIGSQQHKILEIKVLSEIFICGIMHEYGMFPEFCCVQYLCSIIALFSKYVSKPFYEKRPRNFAGGWPSQGCTF